MVALQFLTTVPPLLRRTVTPNELGRSVAFFPLVGLLIGLILFGLHRLLYAAFPSAILAAILLGVWILCSGALHFDGFVDAVDGLLGGRTAEDRMRIMRDERVGAFAIAGGGTLLLLKLAALGVVGVAPVAFIAAPLLGRWVMSAAIVLFPYARAEGLGLANQTLAAADTAVLMVAGLPVTLKSEESVRASIAIAATDANRVTESDE